MNLGTFLRLVHGWLSLSAVSSMPAENAGSPSRHTKISLGTKAVGIESSRGLPDPQGCRPRCADDASGRRACQARCPSFISLINDWPCRDQCNTGSQCGFSGFSER
ncbi:Cystathionine beta-lyase family protein involved in aluminum resistance [Pseudomonas syringae pv. actinidiae]|uniref:Cystathionine beta-lyase family protein involved in aluminum resistance n=1 Tax=Pseudomonas syringae pv. actinidiae TaxID=103796 RepID=A0AAN4TMR5_PSESF|nr:Cystathionine beta-lyase family protein involved in aluminum resistance [Pseudomonas syringae pv. actinidiae]